MSRENEGSVGCRFGWWISEIASIVALVEAKEPRRWVGAALTRSGWHDKNAQRAHQASDLDFCGGVVFWDNWRLACLDAVLPDLASVGVVMVVNGSEP